MHAHVNHTHSLTLDKNILQSRGVKGIVRDRSKVAFLGALLVMVTVTMVMTGLPSKFWETEEVKLARDARMAFLWEGFGPEKGLYNFTLVTAMIDIGRGNWSSKQKRPYNTYLLYMQRVLMLDVNMVIFIDPKGRPFVEWMRRGREKRTKLSTAVTTTATTNYFYYYFFYYYYFYYYYYCSLWLARL
nr:hypothetical protein BaRGS_013274 [Batillaria attramentaria]